MKENEVIAAAKARLASGENIPLEVSRIVIPHKMETFDPRRPFKERQGDDDL